MTSSEHESASERGARRRRVIFTSCSAALVVAAVLAFRAVLLPFILGILVAYVLSPLVARLERVKLGGRLVPRWVAVLSIYVTLLASLVLVALTVTPRVISEVREFAAHEAPAIRDRAQETWIPRVQSMVTRVQRALGQGTPATAQGAEGATAEGANEVREHIRRLGAGHTDDIVRVTRGVIGGVIGGVFSFFMTLMVSAYLLVTEARILDFFRRLVRPQSRDAFDELLRRLDRGLSGVVRGQLIICLVNGSLSAVGFALADLKYWPTLAVVATVFSLVPIFGTVMSSLPAVAIGLTQSFGTAVFVLLWIIGIHQLEANLLNPKIMGDSAKIHPVLVVFSLLAGEHTFGILGALLAVPVMSIAQTFFLHGRKYMLGYAEPAAGDSQH
ncbi:MAG: AI-2E family transporter [Myxococcales bacterium]|nr:AI-2E family transporter [Myxococcales bacterium]